MQPPTKPENFLRLFRLFNGLVQDDLAALFGVKQRNIAMIESSRFRLRSDLVKSIEHAFFISPQFYHFNTPPIFSADVVFFSNMGKLISKDIKDLRLLRQFVEENKITDLYIVNETVLVLKINHQYLFIYSDIAEQIALQISSNIKPLKLDIILSENDIERVYNFPFPKENVSKFIQSFFSIVAPELIFSPSDYLSMIDESKRFIINKIKHNKILEILEIMEFYEISANDLESKDLPI
ncbi:MAG: helix-turn-helix transcriptional regulator [Nitrospirota bacterium]